MNEAAGIDDLPGTLGALAAAGLSGAGAPPDLDGLTAESWHMVLDGIVEERLTGVVLEATAQGLLPLREERVEALALAHEDAMAAALRLESLLLVVAERMEAAGLAFRLLKGPSFAHLDYRAPEVRSFADIDLLVRGDQFDAVAECLTDAGLQRRFDEPRPGFTARYGKGVCFTAPTELEVDVHRALTSGPFALAGSVDVLWERCEHVLLGDRRVPCLAREERAIAAAVHACLGSATPKLVPLRDVAEILRHDIELARLLDLAQQLGVECVLARALLLARATLQLDVPLTGEAWALGYRPTRRERWMLHAYTDAHRSYARQMVAGALAVKGFGARAEYLRAMALPDRSYLASRDASYLRRIGRAARVAPGPVTGMAGAVEMAEAADVQAYSAVGVTFSVASDDPDVLEMVDRLYAHCRTAAPAMHAFEIVRDADGWALGLDGTAVLRDAPDALTLERFAWEVNQLAWASERGGLFVHAGAVVLDDAGVLLCAGSARGKSTLTMGLCERGAQYLSDEIAVIDVDVEPRARMRGFSRPIALRDGSWTLVERFAPNSPPEVAMFMDDVWFLVPDDVVEETTVDVIVFPIYDGGARTRLEPIGLDEAAAIVADQAPHLGALGPAGVQGVAALVAAARLGRLVYSDLEEACAQVRGLAVTPS